MGEIPRGRLTLAFASLLAARIAYAFNWYDVGPVQLNLARGFGVSPGEVSLSLWAFLFAVGLFQIPAGLFSLRTSARTASLVGIVVLGAGATASALVTTLWAFLLLRFVVGIGAAFFFSPAMGLLTEYFEGSRRGLAFGLFNGAFSIGAALAVFATPVLADWAGTEVALLVGGIAMLVIAGENLVALPPVSRRPQAPGSGPNVSLILRSKILWVLALALLGFWAANFAVPQFLVPFAEQVYRLSPGGSGLLDAVLVSTALIGGPIGGYIASRTGRGTLLLAAGGAGVGLSILAIPFVGLNALWGVGVGFGVISGYLFAALYLLPTRFHDFDRETTALSLGLINGIEVLGGSFLVLIGGYYYFGAGNYTGLFEFLALICVVPLPLLLLLRKGRSSGQTVL
jgi:predicted MFS family arabinose efflux permease